MKKLTKSTIWTTIFLLSAFFLSAQSGNEHSYSHVDYMKVKPGNHSDYLKAEKAWKKIHEANIKAGKYDYWSLARVEYPGGDDPEYNYTTRIRFKNRKQLADFVENFDIPDNLSSILTPEEIKLVNRTSELRTRVKSEVWQEVDGQYPEEHRDIKVVVFNYLDYGDTYNPNELERVQQEIWKPVEKELQAANRQNGWAFVYKVMPTGTSENYAYATVDMYGSMEQYLNVGDDYMSYFSKAHPGEDVGKLLKETGNACKPYRQELRIILDRTTSPTDTATKK
ncbi:MAG: hypothetical protein GC192_03530 [Bacteroidetes bacterium]|nr:hypothetical protein [Bacteroidota bacterium]